ncbi:MAG: metallophosphoesterase [Clostridiales bacterium]|nr:metallophosphoesterase [Clostridiales bacterium]
MGGKEAKKKKRARAVLKRLLIALAIIIGAVAVLCCAAAAVSYIGIKSNENFISSLDAVSYDEQLEPFTDDGGYYTFVTDGDFKILQLSDVHIGAGFLCIKKDQLAINAVAAMIAEEKPDLVVVTGDIAYPVPFQAGTLNNKNAAVMFADLMEQLGVYWCLAFGNHDTEAYSYFTREDIAEIYESADYPHCLFQSGSEEVDGVGNYVINVKNSSGEITQSLIMLDSHSYIGGDVLGVLWKYDCVHENQVEWYKEQIAALTAENGGKTPMSLVFLHMPLQEYREAWYEYADNGYEDTENVQYIYGKAGEQDVVVYSSEENYGLFDAALELGSTQGFFCGHDHLNNFSLEYKGIRLTYSYTVDYLAYSGIMKYGLQRGCTVINVHADSSFDCSGENYYQEKYASAVDKEDVTMEDYYD